MYANARCCTHCILARFPIRWVAAQGLARPYFMRFASHQIFVLFFKLEVVVLALAQIMIAHIVA